MEIEKYKVTENIQRYLEVSGLVFHIKEELEFLYDSLFKKIDFVITVVMELGLFHVSYEDKVIIDIVKDNLIPTLSKNLQDEFEFIYNSKRVDVIVLNKKKQLELESGEQFYLYQLEDSKTGEKYNLKTIVSNLDNGQTSSIRLIPDLGNKQYFKPFGLILPTETFNSIIMALSIKKMITPNENIFKISKDLTLDDVDSYNSINPENTEFDRRIIELNLIFFQNTGYYIDEFLKNILEISNDIDKFEIASNEYFKINEEFEELIFKTNYLIEKSFFNNIPLLKLYYGIITKKSGDYLDNCFKILIADAKRYHKDIKNMADAFTQKNISEKIFGFIQKFKEKVQESEIKEECDKHLIECKKLKESFNKLCEIHKNFLEKHNIKINSILGEYGSMYLFLLKDILDKPEEIPYDITEDSKNEENDTIEMILEYLPEELHSIFWFFLAFSSASIKEFDKSYKIINSNLIEKNNSYEIMFFCGQILSLNEDKNYKSYFKIAKKINKEKYTEDLKKFLESKS